MASINSSFLKDAYYEEKLSFFTQMGYIFPHSQGAIWGCRI